MRKNMGRRPEVETLETMVLLSGGAAIPNPLHLTGTDHGTYKVTAAGPTSKGSGSLSPIGKVTASSTEAASGGDNKSVTLTARQGKLFLTENFHSTGLGLYAGTYTITGGTKSFAHETGSGSVQATLIGSLTRGSVTTTYS
jgi:hypothetical protein